MEQDKVNGVLETLEKMIILWKTKREFMLKELADLKDERQQAYVKGFVEALEKVIRDLGGGI